MDNEPSYLALFQSGELGRRAEQAVAGLERCSNCPRRCNANRVKGQMGTCKIGRYARVSSYFPHRGEEDCLSGQMGSGTIFFAQCNLRCVFCQNFDISQSGDFPEVPPERLAEMMLELQEMGCHNINFVTPSHVVAQILEALPLAVEHGLRLPLVFNTSGYDSVPTLQLLDGVIDIYMPDFKMCSEVFSLKYLLAKDYSKVVQAALQEMHRQVGDLALDENGIAMRGLLVRHLVMPGGVAGTEQVMKFISRKLSPNTYVNLMEQYHPAWRVDSTRFAEINRHPTADEYQQALELTHKAGIHRLA
jgi:putative pyruvate formate lyase activating enzyme